MGTWCAGSISCLGADRLIAVRSFVNLLGVLLIKIYRLIGFVGKLCTKERTVVAGHWTNF